MRHSKERSDAAHRSTASDSDTPSLATARDFLADAFRRRPVARCEERRTPCGTVDGIAVTTASYGAVDGLPEPQHGTFYIVSGLVLAAVGDRRADVLAPGPAIRDGEGRIIACDGLSAGPAFAGRR